MTTNHSSHLSNENEEIINYGIQDYQPLNVKDALAYLDQVQEKFNQQPNIYNDFLQVMKEFKSQTIDTPGVIERVSVLFKGHPSLISGFNSFLPPGYRIECLSNDMIKVTAPSPLEFNHAIHYVNKIKDRFPDDEKYQQFLDILHEYQKGEPTAKVYNQIQQLFDGQQDLLSEFKLFLPKTTLPPIPNESEFFDHVKHDINNSAVYYDFLKLHNLYTQRVIDDHTLLERAESFLNNDLFKSYQALIARDQQQHGNKKRRLKNTDIIKQHSECGPSYRMIPKAWRMQQCSGRDELCYQVLNDEYVSHPTWASEDGGFISSKKNHYEEALHQLEDERYSYDLNIVTTLNTISLLEVISQNIESLTQEEKDNFKLPPDLGGHSTTIYKAVIKKVYGKEKGHEIIDMLHTNPIQTIPTLLKRLRQKYEEWVKIQREKTNSWHEIERKNTLRSLDYKSAPFKLNDRKQILSKSLITEIQAIQLDQNTQHEPQFRFDMSQSSILEDVVQLVYEYLKKHHLKAEFHGLLELIQQDFVDTFLFALFDLLKDSHHHHHKPIFIGNTSFYCFFRLFQMAYHRLEVLRDAADDMQEDTRDFQNFVHHLNLTGKALSILQIDFSFGYYHALLQLIDRFFNEDIDQHIYEECLLFLFDKKAYLLFTMDKLILAMIRQLQSIFTTNKKLIQLYHQDQQSVKAYCLKVAQSTDIHDQLYLFTFNPLKHELSIEMLCHSEQVLDDDQYIDYVHTFTDLDQVTIGVDTSNTRSPFLKRNLSHDKDITCLKTMQYKICRNTYHLFYSVGTEHVLLRRKPTSLWLEQ